MNTENQTLQVELWAPDLFGLKGGVQVFSLECARAIGGLEGVRTRRILSLLDSPRRLKESFAAEDGAGWTTGGGGSGAAGKARFVAKALGPRASRPDAILVTHLHLAPVARLLWRLRRIPYGVVVHGIEAWAIGDTGRLKALADARLILPVSDFTGRRVEAQLAGYRVPPFQRFPNTFDSARFKPGPPSPAVRAELGAQPGDQVLLTVGRLAGAERAKGFDEVLEALPVILQRRPEALYVIAGKGPDRERLERKASSLGVRERVRFIGFVSDGSLPDLYRSCDLFLMPSRGEGFGIVLLEAMACGLPCIGSRTDGSADALLQGELGPVVDPGNRDELCRAVVEQLDAGPGGVEADLAGRVEAAFGYDAFTVRMERALRFIAGMGRGGPPADSSGSRLGKEVAS